MPDSAIERIASSEGIFDQDARFALDYKQFAKRGDMLRKSLDDQFKTEFALALKDMEGKPGGDAETFKRIRAMEDSLRKNFCRQALDILCEKNSAQDLSRIRKAMQD